MSRTENRILPRNKGVFSIHFLILVSVLPGTFLSHFSAGLVNIALPNLSIYFDTSVGMTQWVVTGYLLMVMIFLPIMGSVSDKYGKKHIHNLGYLLFGAGIVLSALSFSLWILIAARLLQGLGAAMLQATNMAIVTENYPEEKRGKTLGIISTAVGVGAMLGPSVGGVIINYLSWQMLFWIQAPIIAVSVIIAMKFIPNDRKEKTTNARSMDYVGASLFAISLPSLIYVFNQIGEGEYHLYLLVILLIGTISFITFLKWVKRKKNAFINLNLFAPPMVKAGSLIITVSYMATFATMVVVPFYLQGILQVSTSTSGFLLMTYPLLLAIFGPISGTLSDKFGSYTVVLTGLILMVAALISFSMLTENSSLLLVGFFLSFLGVSMGILTTPNYSLIIGDISIRHLGIVTSTMALLRNLGMAIGTATGVTFMNAFVDGSIQEWMTSSDSSKIDQMMIGFRSFYWLMAFLTILMIIYLLLNSRQERHADKGVRSK